MLAAPGVQEGAVGQLAGEHLLELGGLDLSGQAQLLRALSCPGAGAFVLVGGVVVIFGVVARRVAGGPSLPTEIIARTLPPQVLPAP
jgi:hypothetical protein